MILNPQQQAVIDWGLTGSGSANVIARAGCGKTSTLISLARAVPGRVFLGAFNKAIADELQSRISSNPRATASTMHSIGYRIWRENFRSKCEIDGQKVRSITYEHFPFAKAKGSPEKKVVNAICDAVGFAKQSGFGILKKYGGPGPYEEDDNSYKLWSDLIDYHDLHDEIPGDMSDERFIGYCIRVYSKSLEQCNQPLSRLDFNDMILAPLLFSRGWKSKMYDWVMVDECQDTNATRRMLAAHILKDGGRMVCVGDPRQAIYAFAGASSDAMGLIKRDREAVGPFVELPLTVTYRCPKSVVSAANKWVPDLQAHESAPDGIVREMNHTDLWYMDFDSEADVILCRNTRPLVGIARRLRKSNIACMVEGNSAKGLLMLAEKWGEVSITEFCEFLTQYRADEMSKAMEKDDEEKAAYVAEKCAILFDIAGDLEDEDTTRKLTNRIESLFGMNRSQSPEEQTGILHLCSIHRSKGREWDRVIIIGANRYQPSKWAESKEEKTQEENLMYVSVTRAKREVVQVNVPVPRPGEKEEADWWEL